MCIRNLRIFNSLRTLLIHFLSPSPNGNVLIGFGLSLPMGWMILTGQVTCFGRAEGTVGISGWLIRGLADFFDPATAGFLAPIGLEHFFDAFALNHMRPLRVDPADALQLPLEDVLDTLVVKQARAERYHLTPIWVPEEPPAKRAKTAEVRLSSTGDVSMTTGEEKCEQESSEEEDSDSSGSNSDFSSDDDASEVSDLDKFEEAYKDFRDLTAGVGPRTFERVGSGNTNDDVCITHSSLQCFGCGPFIWNCYMPLQGSVKTPGSKQHDHQLGW